MDRVFWLEKGKVAGRSGPNKDAWDLNKIKAMGIDAILSVNYGEDVNIDAIKALGMDYACVPLSEFIPPREGDVEKCLAGLPQALAYIRRAHAANKTVLIHCRSGKDRTGLTMAYYLQQCYSLTVADAMEQVKAVRDIAFSSQGWTAHVRTVLEKCEFK